MKRSKLPCRTMAQLASYAMNNRSDVPFFLYDTQNGAAQITFPAFYANAKTLSVGLSETGRNTVVCPFTDEPVWLLTLACACFLSGRPLLLSSKRAFPQFLQTDYAKKNDVALVVDQAEKADFTGRFPTVQVVAIQSLSCEKKDAAAGQQETISVQKWEAANRTDIHSGILVAAKPGAEPQFIPFENLLSAAENISGKIKNGRLLHAYPTGSVNGIILSLLVPLCCGATGVLSDHERFFSALQHFSPQTVCLPGKQVPAVYLAAFRFAEKRAGTASPAAALQSFFGGEVQALLCAGYREDSPAIRQFQAAGIPAAGFSFSPDQDAALCGHAGILPFSPPKTPEQKQVELAVRAVLPALSDFSIYADFFSLGGDAFAAQKLAFFLHIHLQTVYDHPFLFDLSKYLHEEQLPQLKCNGNINAVLSALQPSFVPVRSKTALLTGADGFFGAHLLQALIRAGFRVYCLVPNVDPLKEALCFYFGSDRNPAAIPLVGDLLQPDLGLAKSVFTSVSADVSLVIHAAQKTELFGAYDTYCEKNGNTTLNLCDFAKQANAVFALVSDLRVSGAGVLTGAGAGRDFSERTLLIGQNFFENACLMSLAQSENAVITAATKGLDAVILRVGTLAWRNSDGVFCRHPEKSLLLSRLRALKKLGVYEKEMEKLPVSLLPVDVCAAQCVSLMTQKKRGIVYHLADAQPLTVLQWLKKTKQTARHVSAVEAQALYSKLENDADVRLYRLQLFMAERADRVNVVLRQTENELRKSGAEQPRLSADYYKMFHMLSADCKPFPSPLPLLPAMHDPVDCPFAVLHRLSRIQTGFRRSERLEAGDGAFTTLPSILSEVGMRRPFLVFSEALPSKLRQAIKKVSGSEAAFIVTDGGIPQAETFYALLQRIGAGDYDGIVAVGGQSVIGLAKAAAFYDTNDRLRPAAARVFYESAMPPLPWIAVPTMPDAVLEAVSSEIVLSMSRKPEYAGGSAVAVGPEAVILDPGLFAGLSESVWEDAAAAVVTAAVESESCGQARGFASDRYSSEKALAALFSAVQTSAFPPKNGEETLSFLQTLLYAGLGVRRIGGGYPFAFITGVSLLFDLPVSKSRRCSLPFVLPALQPYLTKAFVALAMGCAKQPSERQAEGCTDVETAATFLQSLMVLCGMGETVITEGGTEETEALSTALTDFVQSFVRRTATPVFLSDAAVHKIARDIVITVTSFAEGSFT